jgi:hypothetical protein
MEGRMVDALRLSTLQPILSQSLELRNQSNREA